MSHPIPEDAQRLISRLRLLADELESAARYGVPVPSVLSVSDTPYDYGVSWHAPNADDFHAWVDYTEATVERREHHGAVWHSLTADVNGLSIRLATDVVGSGGRHPNSTRPAPPPAARASQHNSLRSIA